MPEPDAFTTMPMPSPPASAPAPAAASDFLQVARLADAQSRAQWARLRRLVEPER